MKKVLMVLTVLMPLLFSQAGLGMTPLEAAKEKIPPRFEIVEVAGDQEKPIKEAKISGAFSATYYEGTSFYILKDKITGAYYVYSIVFAMNDLHPTVSTTMTPLIGPDGTPMTDQKLQRGSY